MNKNAITFVLLAITTVFSMQANADPYIGIGIGSATYKVDFTTLGGGSLEKDGTGTKFYGGYKFNKYFSAELSAYNFAEASVGSLETSPGSGVFVSAAAEMKGLGAYAVAMYPVSKKFSIMAKAGVLSSDADLQVNSTTAGNSGSDIAYAVAASYAYTKELLAIAEWESFDTDNPELSMISVGFRFYIR